MAGTDSSSTLPSIPIPELLKYGRYGYLMYEITTPTGCFGVEIRGRYQYCRGTQDDLIACGLVKQEWLPGFPGNGFTSNTVVFDATGPRVVVGKLRGVKSLPHIHIRAWGHIQRTVEVRVLMTTDQINQVVSFEKQQKQDRIEPTEEPPSICQYRTDGNVIYLQRRA